MSSPGKGIAIVSLCISLVSLGISIKSIKMSEKEYYSSRIIILKSAINKSNDELLFKTLDPNQHIQSVMIHFSPSIDNTSWDLLPPGYALPLNKIRDKLQGLIEKKYKRKLGYFVSSLKAYMPIIIDTNYIARGEMFLDRSEYFIIYEWLLDDQKNIRPKITFKSLLFKEKLDFSNNPSTLLRAEWDNDVK